MSVMRLHGCVRMVPGRECSQCSMGVPKGYNNRSLLSEVGRGKSQNGKPKKLKYADRPTSVRIDEGRTMMGDLARTGGWASPSPVTDPLKVEGERKGGWREGTVQCTQIASNKYTERRIKKVPMLERKSTGVTGVGRKPTQKKGQARRHSGGRGDAQIVGNDTARSRIARIARRC